MASTKHHSMSVHGRETRSTFIFHKPDNSTTVIYTAALHVRWYSISERLSFSLYKVFFPSHLRVICIHLGKKELQNYCPYFQQLAQMFIFFQSLLSFLIYLTYLSAYSLCIFILFYSLHIFPCEHNLLVNKIFCKYLH